ncbi:MAG: rhomboid family intramembrane serine protease [Nitrospiraceae bacterium]|nr:rhomboid family intramembrane serine protease [Nitrospiraceae bacterium]
MIPIRDTVRSESYPVVNNALIALNVFVFFIELSKGQGLNQFIYTYGLVPARYSMPGISAHFTTGQQVIALFSFMFLHGGFLHLFGNMWFLYIFGDNVEDRLGHFRYFVFYILCGLASGISHLVLNWSSQIPTIGASGAIAGVMGAYFILYPRAKILTLIPLLFFFPFIEIPAFVFLGIWFLFQFMSAATSSAQVSGIAWWAHIGGFIFGIIFLKLFQALPQSGWEKGLQQLAKKRTTARIQVIRPAATGMGADLYETITVTEHEARFGARKLINIAEGLRKKTFILNIPVGTSEGTILRLREMGRSIPGNGRGNLYLKVQIRG